MTKQPAAISCQLSGAYLIEASAGTGKTWTLTGITLRLLIERKVPPEKIIATTFTRASASEIKERIFDRLTQFSECCHWLKKTLEFENLYALNDEQRQDIYKKSNIEILQDPINQYLLNYLLSLADNKLLSMMNYVALVLSKIDKLFVGTLDSLSQKWLKEFVYEGEAMPDLITDNSQMVYSIVHDELRALHSKIADESPQIYALIDTSIFADVSAMIDKTKNTLNFFSAPIDDFCHINDKVVYELTARIEAVIDELICLQEFYDKGSVCHAALAANNKFGKNFHELPNIIELLKNHNIHGFFKINKAQKSLLEGIQANFENPFKKNKEEILNKWLLLPYQSLLELSNIYNETINIANNFNKYIYHHIAHTLRQKLPKHLANNNKTTFVNNMTLLIEHLKDVKNTNLLAHIRHQYPVALIDEAQDINGEQTELINLIYLSDRAKASLYPNFFNMNKNNAKGNSKNNNESIKDKGFLLLVGDPKQAIYRFRGGDVANYNYLKSLGIDRSLVLSENRRSNQTIIHGLNEWFGGDYRELGDDIYYTNINAVKKESLFYLDELKPIELIYFEEDFYKNLALHIKHILAYGSLNNKNIQPSDIAILSNSKKQLPLIKSELNKIDIPCTEALEEYVFDSRAAIDIYQLLLTVLYPTQKNKTALLTSFLFLLSLTHAQDMLLHDDVFADELAKYLLKINELWQKYDVINALEFAFSAVIFDKNIWQRIASFDDGRYLTDTRHIFDILSVTHHSQISLMDWYKKQLSGYNKNLDEYELLSIEKKSAVNLMTIHKSKGLEFAVVYVLGLDKNPVTSLLKKEYLYPYTHHHKRRLSVDESMTINDVLLSELHEKELIEERKRLGYVALTRASEQLFVVINKINDFSPLKIWDFGDKQNVKIPERLDGIIGLNTLSVDENARINDVDERLLIDYMDYHDAYPKTVFQGFYRTSFTALSKLFVNNTQHSQTQDELIESDYDDVGEPSVLIPKQHDFAASFPKGVNAGIFLHKILENIPFLYREGVHEIDIELLRQWIDNLWLKNNLPIHQKVIDFDDVAQENQSVTDLLSWLSLIVKSPFLASGYSLLDLKNKQAYQKSELGFSMSLNHHFSSESLVEIFNKYSGDDKKISDMLNSSRQYDLLNGEIDLLYMIDNKYYIVDYKSNFLASNAQAYTDDVMMEAMNHHHYWLQAVIYQVALHRLLKIRIADYMGNELNYLGAVEYVFLRGIDDCHSTGRISWQVPLELIYALDEMF